jgi:hypothetical protein
MTSSKTHGDQEAPHKLHDSVVDIVTGTCGYCAGAFDAKESLHHARGTCWTSTNGTRASAAVDQPRSLRADQVDWLADSEPVIAVTLRGEPRAYPVQVSVKHEIVNDRRARYGRRDVLPAVQLGTL